ncbi:tRNA1(Val) (adenine(37)-N6)-methyltransferase [Helicobacter ibis]|uniref:Methyltransferase n=1 Tax=Helicobacter ibis TaxID=2962633 RepID=A0ABT4VDA8_9HELI|nr:methyltransferase [Helicobacter ibis]MDA3968690.1 methyltransferase [Helicobacter ibis]
MTQIYQPKNGYCYNSDTLFLYDFALKFLKKDSYVLDVGAGCGILGILCARDISISLSSIEKNKNAFLLCANNFRINKISANCILGDFLEYDFLESRFDFIISNPPFYHSNVIKSENEWIYMARYSENLPLLSMIEKINSILKPNGEFVFCYDSKALCDVLTSLKRYKINPIEIRFVYPSSSKDSTIFLCRAKKNSKSQSKILPPLFTHDNGEFSMEVKEIYKKANTWSIKC